MPQNQENPLLDEIIRKQVFAGEQAVIEGLVKKGLCDPLPDLYARPSERNDYADNLLRSFTDLLKQHTELKSLIGKLLEAIEKAEDITILVKELKSKM